MLLVLQLRCLHSFSVLMAATFEKCYQCPCIMFAPTGTSTFGTNQSLKSHRRHHQRYIIWAQSQHDLCCPEPATVLIFCFVGILIALNISLLLNRKISTMTTLPARVSRGPLPWTEHERRERWINPSPKTVFAHSICCTSRTCTPCHTKIRLPLQLSAHQGSVRTHPTNANTNISH